MAEGIPTVSNGGLAIKADGASINGTFGVSGGVKTWTSPDGVTWTRNGSLALLLQNILLLVVLELL